MRAKAGEKRDIHIGLDNIFRRILRPMMEELIALVVCGRKIRAIIPGLGISDVLCNEVSKFVQDTCYAVAHWCYEMKRKRREEKDAVASVAFRGCGKCQRGITITENGLLAFSKIVSSRNEIREKTFSFTYRLDFKPFNFQPRYLAKIIISNFTRKFVET